MELQQEIIERFTIFFLDDVERIRGAILIGSFGRGQGTPESDIDFELLIVEGKVDMSSFTNDVTQLFELGDDALVVHHTIWLADQRKLALYHGPQLLLTELYLYSK
jgi:predicted nucleotidyltransferase